MYPEPEMCLDLATWQEFCGFDMAGCTCDLEISIDSDNLIMEIRVGQDLPAVKTDEKVPTDFFGSEAGAQRVAGPFAGLKAGSMRFSIDPRKKSD